jgi:hypothetical protein
MALKLRRILDKMATHSRGESFLARRRRGAYQPGVERSATPGYAAAEEPALKVAAGNLMHLFTDRNLLI